MDQKHAPHSSPVQSQAPGLIADIGGTNIRLALVESGSLDWHDVRVFQCVDYPSPVEAVQTYLAAIKPAVAPDRAAFCVACPVLGDIVSFTNNHWSFSIEAARVAMGFNSLQVVNDFVANALACPRLSHKDKVRFGGPEIEGRPGFPVAAIGPGTGLGVALLVPDSHGHWVPVATEGGHVTVAATNVRERNVIETVAQNFSHVSAERLVSGQGLQNIFNALCVLENLPVDPGVTPADISTNAVAGSNPLAVEALHLFCAFLGNVAGNLALSSGAFGGVNIMGGIIPRVFDFAKKSAFRERFDEKGRMKTAFLDKIPTWLVTHDYPAFLGLAGLVSDCE